MLSQFSSYFCKSFLVKRKTKEKKNGKRERELLFFCSPILSVHVHVLRGQNECVQKDNHSQLGDFLFRTIILSGR